MSLMKKQFFLDDNTSVVCWIYIIKKDGIEEFWFKAKDIALFLDYKNTRSAILSNVNSRWRKEWWELTGTTEKVVTENDETQSSIDPEETLDNITNHEDTMTTTVINADGIILPRNWQPHTVFISEPGLYSLVLRSKKPETEKFTGWICEDVLPSIRRIGTYRIEKEKESALLDINNRMLTYQLQNVEMSKQIATLQSDAEKQLVAVKNDAERQLALVKSESEQMILSTRLANVETLRQVQSQYYIAENRYKMLEYKTELEIQQLKALARTNLMEFAVNGLLARDNIEQNNMLRGILKRIAPRVVPEVQNVQQHDYVAIYRYLRNKIDYFRVIRGQLRYIEGLDAKVAKYQSSVISKEDREKIKKIDLWTLNAVRLFKAECANSTRLWNKFKQTNTDFVYGTYLFNSATTLRFLDEKEIREKYQLDKKNSTLFDATGLSDENMPRSTREFRDFKFIDEDDAVARCLTPWLATGSRFVELFDEFIERLNKEAYEDCEVPSKRSRQDYTPLDVSDFLNDITSSNNNQSSDKSDNEKQRQSCHIVELRSMIGS
ncbi:hypothetical protein DOLIC_00134 [Dolichomitus sp. PSUC_FEM 10030005]|nr:hypothetical protein [Dolichomitus sp. PSUC_FEM 10030005]